MRMGALTRSASTQRRVAVCLTDPRDGNQSNNAASGAAHHMVAMSKGMNGILKPGMSDNRSGTPLPFLQTTGGTVFMFDLWKRGVNPFETLVEHFRATPDIPTSWLNRNVCLNGMEPYPREVVREYFQLIKAAKREAGNTQPYIMQSFCAQNDLNNLSVTFEEWQELGDDFWTMPFFSFAKTPWDPCESNPERTAAWFREVRAMTGGTEMYGLKQPEGDMTSSYAQCHAEAIRAEIGDEAQLHLHTQGNHGLGMTTLLGAVRGGVTSVDSSFVFGGRGGQEDSFALRYLLQSEGFTLNDWDEDGALNMWNENFEKWYPNTHNYWRPDPIRANIAGGQRTILQDELNGMRQGHRMKEVFDFNMTMRCLGGGGVSVTPLADIYARNSLLWIRSPELRALTRKEAEDLRRKPANSAPVEDFLSRWATGAGSAAEGDAMDELLGLGSTTAPEVSLGVRTGQVPLTPDFTKLLLGHNGQHPCPPSTLLMESAMHQMVTARATASPNKLNKLLIATQLADEAGCEERRTVVVQLLKALSRRALAGFRLRQIDQRVEELKVCTVNESFRALLEQELALAQQVDENGKAVETIDDRVQLYEKEKTRLETALGEDSRDGLSLDVTEEEYANFLRTGELDDKHVNAIQAHDACQSLLSDAGSGGLGQLLQLCRKTGYKTVPMNELIADNNALGESRDFMHTLDDEWLLGLNEKQLAEWSLIYAKFRFHPLKLVQRYWRHQLGIEKVFTQMSTDPTELDESSFGPGEFTPLSFPKPARLTSLYKSLGRRVKGDVEKGIEQGDAHCTKAYEALKDLENVCLERQFWEARGAQLNLPIPVDTKPAGIKNSIIVISAIPRSGAGVVVDAAPITGDAKTQEQLNQKLGACDAKVAKCKASILPVLQAMHLASPGEFNQSLIRSIDDPSKYRDRFTASQEQVDKEVESMWQMLELKVFSDALKKNQGSATRFSPCNSLDLE